MLLLGQIFLYPGREQTLAELQQATGIPQQTVSREVGRLLKAGFLSGRRAGRLHYVKPNEKSPYFPELSGLLLKALGPRTLLTERLLKLEGIEEATCSVSGCGAIRGSPAHLQATSTWS